MKLTKDNLHTFAAALTLGALSVGFTPAAMAATYDASASFTLTLTDVTNANFGQVTEGWSVDALGSGTPFLSESGDASATGTSSVADVSLSIDSGFTQSSSASGTATDGFSSTDTLTDLDIFVDNFSGQALTFSFDYDFSIFASATGDEANASAAVDMLDDIGSVDILTSVSASAPFGRASDSDSGIGTIQFTLLDGEFNVIAGFIDSTGDAASVVPVPAAVWLFGSGLLGLVGVARRKQVA